MRNDTGALPVVSVTAAIAALSLMDAVVKIETANYATFQVVAMRYVFGAAFALPLFLWALRSGARVGRQSLTANAGRGVVIVATACSFFYAVAVLPLAEAVAITFLAPLFMALWARVLLGETVSRRVYGAIAVGFLGVVVILAGQLGDVGTREPEPLGIAAALACAVLYALVNVLIRKQSVHDGASVMVFLQALFALLILLPLASLFWRPLATGSIGNFALAGLLGTLGHLLIAWGFARARAARLGVLEYTAFPWAAFFGWSMFGEVPGWETFAGAALIIAAALYGSRAEAHEEPVGG